jgi:hypothetical protein
VILVRNKFSCGLILATVILASGCAGETIMQGPAQVELLGTLAGERIQSRECLLLIDSANVKWHLVVPAGWTVRFEPVRVIDPDGSLVAEDGDRVEVRGPSVTGDTSCSPMPAFAADEIIPLD